LSRNYQTNSQREPAATDGAVQSLDRALNLLLAFRDQPALTLPQLAAVLPIHRTSTYRLVRTLVRRGFLAQDREGRYRLGPTMQELGGLALARQDVQRFAREMMQRVADETSETVQLLVRDGAHVQVIDGVESPHRVKVGAGLGERRPLHATAAGKCVLAYFPAAERRRLMTTLERLTPHTIVDPTRLEAELDRVRQKGYAVNDQESEPGARFVAVPIFNGLGHFVAAIAVGAPADRLSVDAMHALGKRLATGA
jgi:DNA-binding IclR family transcriptional regulator